ncbi:nitroreductase family protein [Breoghania sp.]|uniref:nitroreductase family protein n=1 Tax=Breoghania sp. TaxID=2065378 RepID=UPI002621F984|nr:nitroreductase family protein [Breoghania sp.]MDJ0931400.1 nitroreductase family protein [Breoghania sp.]
MTTQTTLHVNDVEPSRDDDVLDLPKIGSRARYDPLMAVIRNRVTARAFDPDFTVPEEHYDLILDAARHAPLGANSQPWHFVVVRDPDTKRAIADYFVDEQRARAKMKMKFPTPAYRGLATAPGFIVVASDFRWVQAFPVLKNDDSDLNRICTGRTWSAS